MNMTETMGEDGEVGVGTSGAAMWGDEAVGSVCCGVNMGGVAFHRGIE